MPSGFKPFLRRSNEGGNVHVRRTAFQPRLVGLLLLVCLTQDYALIYSQPCD